MALRYNFYDNIYYLFFIILSICLYRVIGVASMFKFLLVFLKQQL